MHFFLGGLQAAWNCKVVPIRLHEASQVMQSKTRQRRVTQHCDVWLRARGLPCTRPITVQVAHKELVPWVRGRLRAALCASKIGLLQGRDLHVAQNWLLKRVRIQLVRPKLWSDSWSARKGARTTDARSPMAIPREGPAHCVRQSWRVEKRLCPDFLLQAALEKKHGGN